MTAPAFTPGLICLGDFLGTNRHFGHCPTCSTQHVSTHDRGRPYPVAPWQFQCAKCATRGAK